MYVCVCPVSAHGDLSLISPPFSCVARDLLPRYSRLYGFLRLHEDGARTKALLSKVSLFMEEERLHGWSLHVCALYRRGALTSSYMGVIGEGGHKQSTPPPPIAVCSWTIASGKEISTKASPSQDMDCTTLSALGGTPAIMHVQAVLFTFRAIRSLYRV